MWVASRAVAATTASHGQVPSTTRHQSGSPWSLGSRISWRTTPAIDGDGRHEGDQERHGRHAAAAPGASPRAGPWAASPATGRPRRPRSRRPSNAAMSASAAMTSPPAMASTTSPPASSSSAATRAERPLASTRSGPISTLRLTGLGRASMGSRMSRKPPRARNPTSPTLHSAGVRPAAADAGQLDRHQAARSAAMTARPKASWTAVASSPAGIVAARTGSHLMATWTRQGRSQLRASSGGGVQLQPHELAAALLGDEPRQRAGEGRADDRLGRRGRRPGEGRQVDHVDEAVGVTGPHVAQPPAVVGRAGRRHADLARRGRAGPRRRGRRTVAGRRKDGPGTRMRAATERQSRRPPAGLPWTAIGGGIGGLRRAFLAAVGPRLSRRRRRRWRPGRCHPGRPPGPAP